MTTVEGPHDQFSWFSSFLQYCAPLTSCLARKSRRRKSLSLATSKASWPSATSSDQDLLIDKDEEDSGQEKMARPFRSKGKTSPLSLEFGQVEEEKPPRKSFASSKKGAVLKKPFRSARPGHRPHISAPSDFRHLESGSFDFPPPDPPPSQPREADLHPQSSLKPLELSIYMTTNRMSPILPHFEFPKVQSPQQVVLQERLENDHEIVRQRGYSVTPFHIPRKPVSADSLISQGELPQIPPKSQARGRAHTSPEVEYIKARVATAMVEVEKLQKQIDDVVERQSLYSSSRPSTSNSMAKPIRDLEPMPSIPALPPAAPSFAQRIGCKGERPHTAPLTPIQASPVMLDNGEGHWVEQAAAPMAQQSNSLPPPLPLVLRPPLRKKKSFSRVSTWLFPNGRHSRDMSLDSVTNAPRPVKGTEGFYQCVRDGSSESRRVSFESFGSYSTWESDDEQHTVPTTWSPESTPVTKSEDPPGERSMTFGKNSIAP